MNGEPVELPELSVDNNPAFQRLQLIDLVADKFYYMIKQEGGNTVTHIIRVNDVDANRVNYSLFSHRVGLAPWLHMHDGLYDEEVTKEAIDLGVIKIYAPVQMVGGNRTRRSLSRKANGKCPSGYHPRRSYRVRRTGTRVAGACVRATTKSGPRSDFLRASRKRMSTRLRGIRKTRRGVSSCPSGKIVRDAYVRIRRGRRQFVPAACITNVGNPGKGLPSGAPGIGPLRKGDLTQFGYDNVMSMTEGRRHLALAAAVRAYGPLTVWRKLNAVFIYTKHTSPASSRIFKADRDWIKAHYGITAF